MYSIQGWMGGDVWWTDECTSVYRLVSSGNACTTCVAGITACLLSYEAPILNFFSCSIAKSTQKQQPVNIQY